MLRLLLRLLGFAVAVVLPTVALAQRPETPNERASERAQAMVALHRATHRRGSVVRVAPDRDRNSAMSARAGRASPLGDGPDDPTQPPSMGQPVAPGRPQTPALPPAPARKSGPSISHRP
jgi:hypothetical protein